MKVALYNNLVEVSYPQYAPQDAIFVHEERLDEWFNTEVIKFPTYVGVNYIPVDSVVVGSLYVRLSARQVISDGMSMSFAVGAMRVDGLLYDTIIPQPSLSLPTNCKKCNHYNEYVGLEHLTSSGEYICRSCKRNDGQ